MAAARRTPPPIGTLVFSADGHEVGRVEEVSDTCFKLDIQFGPDWWLGADTVANEADGTAILRLTLEAIRNLTIQQAGDGHLAFHLHP